MKPAVALIACALAAASCHRGERQTDLPPRAPEAASAEPDIPPISLELQAVPLASPNLAWIIPPGRLLTTQHSPHATVLSARGIEGWTYDSMIGPHEVAALRSQYSVGCDLTPDQSLYSYSLPGAVVDSTDRVFASISPPPDDAGAGLVPVAIPAAILASLHDSLRTGHPGATFRDTAFAAAAGEEYFSFHAVYDTSSTRDSEVEKQGGRYLVRQALALHAATGKVLGWTVSDIGEQMCDGCGIPGPEHSFRAVYDVEQVFRVPGLPHPLLLLDTSTVEGRALSLVTFDQAGAYSVYRDYEYVVGCFH